MDAVRNAYYHILKQVLKPARYIGGEINQILKEKYEVHFCLAFPDSYEIGMSHLGMRILYHYLNKNSAIYAERVFAPWPDLEIKLREADIPLLSLETKTPLSHFDAIGFSFQYELEYTNVLTMLDLAGIPLFTEERDDSVPIVLAGGPVVVNPEPMSEFIDAFLIGDGEEVLEKILLLIRQAKQQNLGRIQTLAMISKLPGVYVPAFSQSILSENNKTFVRFDSNGKPLKIKKHLLRDLNRYPFPDDIILPHTEIVHDRISIEIARGCTQGCRFCQAGFIYRPVRERTVSSLYQSIENSICNTGYKDVSLTSLSPADFGAIRPLMSGLSNAAAGKDISLHLSSLRVYGLTKELTEQMSTGRKTGFTIAPEAGSQRMRDVINKNISEEDIFRAAENAFSGGWELIKLYTMIGLPLEKMEDVEAIADMAIQIFKLGRKIIGKRARINLAVSTFIPKPFTPFQWAPLISREELTRRQDLLKKRLIPYKNINFNFPSYDVSILEGILSRSDKSAGRMIYLAWKKGARFDAWRDQFKFGLWQEAMEQVYPNQLPFVSGFDADESLPWDHIDVGVSKQFLHDELKKSEQVKVTAPCEQPVAATMPEKETKILTGKPYVCYKCGLECDLNAIQEFQKLNLEQSLPNHEMFLLQDKKRNDKTTRYIAQFRKIPPIHLLSHLDQYSIFKRLFTRAGIRIKYSEGYRPRPVISMPGALGLGVISYDEWMMFTLLDEWEAEELLKQLNKYTPEGLTFSQIRKVNEKIDWTRYHLKTQYQVRIPVTNGVSNGYFVQLEEFNRQSTWLFNKEKKKRTVAYDLKEFFELNSIENVDEELVISLTQNRKESGTPSVADFARHVLNLNSADIQIIKIKTTPHPL